MINISVMTAELLGRIEVRRNVNFTLLPISFVVENYFITF